MRKALFARISMFAALTTLICAGLTGLGFSQQSQPRFERLTPRYLNNVMAPATSTIPFWSGTVSGNSFSMVGTDPASTNTTTTITAYLFHYQPDSRRRI